MQESTRRLWAAQNRHENNRLRLFEAVQRVCSANTALYPGSFVDISPSAVIPSVTYVDIDRRTPRFFADEAGVRSIIADLGGAPSFEYRFLHGDYQSQLELADESVDLLISLYAGFVSEHCTRYLRIGGTLLVNPSHGDAAMASIDPRYELTGAVMSRSSAYEVTQEGLDQHMVPKKSQKVTVELLRQRGRGIAYTKPAFAYLFERRR